MSRREDLSLESALFDDLHNLEEGDDDALWDGWPAHLKSNYTPSKPTKSKYMEPDETFLNLLRYRARKTPDFRKLRGDIYQEHLVFVYGSLKRGYYNDHYLEDAHYVGLGLTADNNFLLYPGGGFPVLFKEDNKKFNDFQGRVRGEVYAVNLDTLCKLDYLESNGSMYHRVKTRVVMKEQNIAMDKTNCITRPILSCFTYIGDRKYWDRVFKQEGFQSPNNSEYGTSLGWKD